MKKLLKICMCIVVALLLFSCGSNVDNVQKSETRIKESNKIEDKKLEDGRVCVVGITQFNDSDINVEIRKGIIQGLRENGFKEGENIIYKNQNAKNNVSYIGQINQKFLSDGCEMIIAIGENCTTDAIENAKTKNVNVIFTGISDSKKAGYTDKDLVPLCNATGTIEKYDINKNFQFIKSTCPNVSKLGVIYYKNDLNSKRVIDEMKYYGSNNNIDIVSITINKVDDVQMAYDTLYSKVDAIMIINDSIVASNCDYIINKAIENKVPIFSFVSKIIEKGAIGGYSIDLAELGRETGRIASDVLFGDDIKNIHTKNIDNTTLYINKKAIDNFSIEISDDLLKGAIVYE